MLCADNILPFVLLLCLHAHCCDHSLSVHWPIHCIAVHRVAVHLEQRMPARQPIRPPPPICYPSAICLFFVHHPSASRLAVFLIARSTTCLLASTSVHKYIRPSPIHCPSAVC
ncbi:hypothetical protein HOY80DRAFT_958166 [Tuber brumale]|nr:hypothetical protein HOY80DRAFT_958166 [Tuber brumale]